MNNHRLLKKAPFIKQTLLAVLAIFLVTSSNLSFSEEKTLSRAELAAMAAHPRDRAGQLIRLCNNALLHVSDIKKNKLIEKLDGKTCKEMVELHFPNQ